MPKVLGISENKILDVADKILREEGYKELSVRKVANLCGIAVGTFYLYFPSKDDLVANAILRSWKKVLSATDAAARDSDDFTEGIIIVYRATKDFSDAYTKAFSEYSGTVGSHHALASRHLTLRLQIAERVAALANNTGHAELAENSDMIAECVLTTINQSDMNENTLRKFINLTLK